MNEEIYFSRSKINSHVVDGTREYLLNKNYPKRYVVRAGIDSVLKEVIKDSLETTEFMMCVEKAFGLEEFPPRVYEDLKGINRRGDINLRELSDSIYSKIGRD